MNLMRFKVGDKVRIKDECKINETYGKLYFTGSMEQLKGRLLIISQICPDIRSYCIKEDDICYYSDEMLEPFEFKVGDEVVTEKQEE